jgi:hypothetical protein
MDCVDRWHWAGISLLVALTTGCGWPEVVGSGHVVTEERQLSDFMALDVSDGLETTVVVDETQPTQVRVTGDDNLVEQIQTEQAEAGTLSVHFRDHVGGWSSPNPLRVEMTVPRLASILSSGGGTIDLGGTVSVDSLQITASGGGTVRARGLATQSLDLTMSGGGDVTLAGQSYRVTSALSGGSVLHARDLYTRDASLNSSGGGVITLRVSDTLRVLASGGAEVHIVGHPSISSEALSGGSTLTFE